MPMEASSDAVDQMNASVNDAAFVMPLSSEKNVVMKEGDDVPEDIPASPFQNMEGEVRAEVCSLLSLYP